MNAADDACRRIEEWGERVGVIATTIKKRYAVLEYVRGEFATEYGFAIAIDPEARPLRQGCLDRFPEATHDLPIRIPRFVLLVTEGDKRAEAEGLAVIEGIEIGISLLYECLIELRKAREERTKGVA